MATMVINGAPVDSEDPCALWQALYAVKIKIVAGEQVQEYSIQSPVTRETVVFSSIKPAALYAELNRLAAACQEKQTGRRPSRRWNFRH